MQQTSNTANPASKWWRPCNPQATAPLAAHVQYWDNELLGEQLYQFVS